MHHDPPRTSGKVLRRYIVEEEVYPAGLDRAGWEALPRLPPQQESRASRFGWEVTDWLRRRPFALGVVLTLVVVATLVLTLHLTQRIRFGPPCTHVTMPQKSPAGRTLPTTHQRR